MRIHRNGREWLLVARKWPRAAREWLWMALAVALLGVASACGSGAASPPTRIPPKASNFAKIPAPCSLVSKGTLTALGLPTKAEPQAAQRETGVTEQTCSWGYGPGGASSRNALTVSVALFTEAAGQDPVAAAQSGFQENASTQSQADSERGHTVSGLANGAVITHVIRGDLGSSQVNAWDRNVVVSVVYEGLGPLKLSVADSGALTATRAVLQALSAS
jgi:hypothetical protein